MTKKKSWDPDPKSIKLQKINLKKGQLPRKHVQGKPKVSEQKPQPKELTEVERDHQLRPFYKLGQAYIAFGKALQDPDVKIGHLVGLAHDCGIELRFGFVSGFKVETALSEKQS